MLMDVKLGVMLGNIIYKLTKKVKNIISQNQRVSHSNINTKILNFYEQHEHSKFNLLKALAIHIFTLSLSLYSVNSESVGNY